MSNEKLLEVFERWSTVRAQRKALEEEEAALKQVLSTLIPEGKSKAGIAHVLRQTSSIAYKSVLERVRDELVPKSKHGVIPGIIEAYTTHSMKHDFERGA